MSEFEVRVRQELGNNIFEVAVPAEEVQRIITEFFEGCRAVRAGEQEVFTYSVEGLFTAQVTKESVDADEAAVRAIFSEHFSHLMPEFTSPEPSASRTPE